LSALIEGYDRVKLRLYQTANVFNGKTDGRAFAKDPSSVKIEAPIQYPSPLRLGSLPILLEATPEQRSNWKVSGAGYGIHWPDIDEDLSTEGLLRGAPAAPEPVHARK
jgi:hypothetical protein